MKTSTALIIGGAALAVLLIWTRSRSTALPLSTSSSSTTDLLGLLGAGAALGKLFGGSSSTSSTPDTATSNYLADATAASDSETGVVGFGGWDD